MPLPVMCFFDRAYGYAPVWDALTLAPGSEGGEEAAVGVRGIDTRMAADFFEEQGIDGGCVELVEPALEAQVAHAAALEALWRKVLGALCDQAVAAVQRPASVRAQVEGKKG